MRPVQEDLERHGYFFHPIEKEHTEWLITDLLLACIRTKIRKRGFAKVASRTAITLLWLCPESQRGLRVRWTER
jgi:hypothetical protein